MQLLAQHLPRSWEAIGRARAADENLGRLWSEVVRTESIGEHVLTGPDGLGTLLVSISWPLGMRSQLTDVFRELVDACWAALDAAVEDAVHQFGNRHRLVGAARERYFPVAPDVFSMDGLSESRCLDGLPRDLFGLVMAVQQFAAGIDEDPADEPEPLTRARSALGTLLGWTSALDDGARLTAWATPVEPQVHVKPPVSLSTLTASEPGPVEPDAVVATYTLTDYTSDDAVRGQVGTFIDLALGEGFQPADQDDTLSGRIRSVLVAVASICLQFAHRLSSDAGVPGLRVLGADDSWVRVDGPLSGWTAAELEAVRGSELGLGVVTERQFTTLVVDTGEGIYERVIRAASPLNSSLTRGRAAEAAALSAAATWGLPDFVMRPKVEKTSSGVREIGDGLLVVGEKGLVLQSKAREGEVGDDPEKERRWVSKAPAQGTWTDRRHPSASR